MIDGPLRMFADRNRSGTYVIMLSLAAAMFGMFFYIVLFVQNVLGYSPISAGVFGVPTVQLGERLYWGFDALDMVAADARDALVADFVKRMKYKGPVFQISALTREGCEHLIKDIFKHIKAQQVSEQPPEYVDPRFAEPTPE